MEVALIFIIILSCITLIALGAFGFLIYKFYTKFPSILGEKIRISKAQGSKIQAKMNDLVESDVSHFINENPMMLEIFPSSIEHMEVTNGQPQFINSIISMFAPAISSVLMNSGSNQNLMASNVAGGLLSNPDAITSIFSFISQFREQAKKNYKPKEITATTSSSSSSKAPRAEGYTNG